MLQGAYQVKIISACFEGSDELIVSTWFSIHINLMGAYIEEALKGLHGHSM